MSRRQLTLGCAELSKPLTPTLSPKRSCFEKPFLDGAREIKPPNANLLSPPKTLWLHESLRGEAG